MIAERIVLLEEIEKEQYGVPREKEAYYFECDKVIEERCDELDNELEGAEETQPLDLNDSQKTAPDTSTNWHVEEKIFVRMLAQKLIFIHNFEKRRSLPRWRTNVDWAVKIRNFSSLSVVDFPDTVIVNWKAGGTSKVCWEKQIHIQRNKWFCDFLGIDPEAQIWSNSDIEVFQSFYLKM